VQGLGTSDDKDARDYFSNMERHMISFRSMTDADKEAVELAFSKKKADARKDWLRDLEVAESSTSSRYSLMLFLAWYISQS
jgi:DNA topoisomerase II